MSLPLNMPKQSAGTVYDSRESVLIRTLPEYNSAIADEGTWNRELTERNRTRRARLPQLS
jgi:hypothetical protein